VVADFAVEGAVWLEFGGTVLFTWSISSLPSQEKSMLVASVLLAVQICPVQQPKANSPPPLSSNRI